MAKEDMTMSRVQDLEQRVRVLDNALWRAARSGCSYHAYPVNTP